MCFNYSNTGFNYSDACSTTQMLLSIARLPVKLVKSLLLVISRKLDSSDKLKMVLLNRYKALRD
jgi:hypothetical protein